MPTRESTLSSTLSQITWTSSLFKAVTTWSAPSLRNKMCIPFTSAHQFSFIDLQFSINSRAPKWSQSTQLIPPTPIENPINKPRMLLRVTVYPGRAGPGADNGYSPGVPAGTGSGTRVGQSRHRLFWRGFRGGFQDSLSFLLTVQYFIHFLFFTVFRFKLE